MIKVNKKEKTVFKTIQISSTVKEHVSNYCNWNGLNISKYIELLVLFHLSGSNANSVIFKK